jgi:hypothetical protein
VSLAILYLPLAKRNCSNAVTVLCDSGGGGVPIISPMDDDTNQISRSDAFQKRERANEDYIVKQREKEKLLDLRKKLAEQQQHLERLSQHMYVLHLLQPACSPHRRTAPRKLSLGLTSSAVTRSPRTRAASRTKSIDSSKSTAKALYSREISKYRKEHTGGR